MRRGYRKYIRLKSTRRKGCVAVMTGPTDWISDGAVVVQLENGHKMLGDITGSGCVVGTCVATFCAGASLLATAPGTSSGPELAKLVRGDMLIGAVGGSVTIRSNKNFVQEKADK